MPKIIVDVVAVEGNPAIGENEYYCDIANIKDTDESLIFRVEWTQSTKLIRDQNLYETSFVRYDDQFRESTKLTETHLRNKGVTKLGFTVSFVKAFN